MKTIDQILEKYPEEFHKIQNGDINLGVGNSPLMEELYEYFIDNGEMPYGVAKARTGDPDTWILNYIERYM